MNTTYPSVASIQEFTKILEPLRDREEICFMGLHGFTVTCFQSQGKWYARYFGSVSECVSIRGLWSGIVRTWNKEFTIPIKLYYR